MNQMLSIVIDKQGFGIGNILGTILENLTKFSSYKMNLFGL